MQQLERNPLNDVQAMTPTIIDAGRHAVVMKAIARLDALCDADTPALAVAFAYDADSLATLMRYETTLRRNLQRALHELERRQAVRASVPVPPPAAMDIDVGDGIPGFFQTNPTARLSLPVPQRLARAPSHRHDRGQLEHPKHAPNEECDRQPEVPTHPQAETGRDKEVLR
jgi:hypothetical protein